MAFFRNTISTATPAGPAGGDFGGSYPNPTVISIADVTTGTLAYNNGGTGQSSWTKGDILYASNTNTLSKLSIGSAGQVLKVAAGLPSWGSGSGSSLVTASFAGASTQTLTFNPSSFTQTYVYANPTSTSANNVTLYLSFNNDTNTSNYSVSHGIVYNSGGANTLAFSNGNGLPLNGTDLVNGSGNPECNYFVLVAVSGSTTTYTIVGEYIDAVPQRAGMYITGTYNAAATTVTIASNPSHSFDGAINAIQVA